jgi:hypothetical protein
MRLACLNETTDLGGSEERNSFGSNITASEMVQSVENSQVRARIFKWTGREAHEY